MAKKSKVAEVYPSPAMAKQEREWRARNDLETLQRAQEIQGDKGRVRAAQRVAREQLAALSKVAKTPSRSKR